MIRVISLSHKSINYDTNFIMHPDANRTCNFNPKKKKILSFHLFPRYSLRQDLECQILYLEQIRCDFFSSFSQVVGLFQPYIQKGQNECDDFHFVDLNQVLPYIFCPLIYISIVGLRYNLVNLLNETNLIKRFLGRTYQETAFAKWSTSICAMEKI